MSTQPSKGSKSDLADHPVKTLEELRKGAEENNANDQYELAMRHYEGAGINKYDWKGKPIDEVNKETIRLMTLAADQKHAKAQCFLGVFYDGGRMGVKKDQKKAAELYKLSADQGYEVAIFNLAHCYMHGEGVEKDEKEAAKLYGIAADKNYASAQYNLALCYENATGVKKDSAKAIDLFHLAAENGDEDAQRHLGKTYLSMAGDEINDYLKTGIFWLEKAANHPTITATRTKNALITAGFWKEEKEKSPYLSESQNENSTENVEENGKYNGFYMPSITSNE